MGQINWSNKASSNLQAIHAYIARDSNNYATRFIKDLIAATGKLEKLPRCGRIVPELNSQAIREVIYRDYRIVYRLVGAGDDVEILAVVHGAQRVESAMSPDWEL